MGAPLVEGAATASNPWLSAAGGIGSALGGVLGGTAGPSSADAVFGTNLQFDNSGWNVAFGNSSASSQSDKTTSQGGASGLSGNISSYLPWALLFVGGLVAYKMFKKSK